MNRIKNWFANYLSTRKDIQISRLVEEDILGKTYRVIKGTIRKNPDYDDAWLFALSREAKIIFDIGCNIGQSSLLMLHDNAIHKLLLVDPNPLALSQAAQNLIMNGYSSKACFVCAFVSDKPGEELEFFTVGSGAAGSMYASHAGTAKKMKASFSVSTTTVDVLIEAYHMVPDLVKIDVEGAETKVLIGSQGLAAQQNTRFFLEVHSSPISMHDNATKIIDWCHNNDYQAWYLKEKVLLIEPHQIAHRGRCHLLLLPKNEQFPEYLLPLKQGAKLEEVAAL